MTADVASWKAGTSFTSVEYGVIRLKYRDSFYNHELASVIAQGQLPQIAAETQ